MKSLIVITVNLISATALCILLMLNFSLANQNNDISSSGKIYSQESSRYSNLPSLDYQKKITGSYSSAEDIINFEVSFFQMDYNYYDSVQMNSDWGSIQLITDDFVGMKLLNLSVIAPGVDSLWQIKNFPVISTSSIRDTMYFKFDIGTAGIDVNSIIYGVSLTDSLMLIPPAAFLFAPVSSMLEMHTEQINAKGPVTEGTFFPVAEPLPGIVNMNNVVYNPNAFNKNFPKFNQLFINGMVESAVSNSLHFLNEQHVLFLDDDSISPSKLQKVLKNDSLRVDSNWITKKDNYMKKANLGITTRFLSKDSIEKLLDHVRDVELKNHQDVEMVIKNKEGKFEVYPVTGIIMIETTYTYGNRKYKPAYVIKYNKDNKPMVYDPTGKDVSEESGVVAGEKFNVNSQKYERYNKFVTCEDSIAGFVVECPGPQFASSPVNPANNSASVNPYPQTISWNPLPLQNSYWLEVATDIEFNNKIIDSTHVNHPYVNMLPNTLNPNTQYFWRVRANDSVGPGKYDMIYTFTTISAQTIDLRAIIQGFYNPVTKKMVKDTVKVYLRNSFPPNNLADSAKNTLDSAGSGMFNFYQALPGLNYFIVLKHRNSIETWSSIPVILNPGILYYDFTTAPGMAFGNNMIQIDNSPLRYAIYSGDVNQDGFVNLADLVSVFNSAITFFPGYKTTDLNGDNITDLSDVLLAFNNSSKFVSRIRP
ncbi:MAG TPA: hypothetical protein PKC91_00345 [Ignavibacteria bacterium]|nr:hypothetical protein [Ignavibacteria bacterium]